MTGSAEQTANLGRIFLPEPFRRIWLELALEARGSERNGSVGYVLVAPLTEDGGIDLDLWRRHHDACGVIRFRPREPDDVGHLVRTTGDTWAFRFDVTRKSSVEPAYHLGPERLAPGGYVFIHDDTGPRIFRVASIESV